MIWFVDYLVGKLEERYNGRVDSDVACGKFDDAEREEDLTRGSHPLMKHSFAQVGTTNAFEARPAIVHFGGYEVNKVHEQVVRVLNRTKKSQRLHILNPSTPYFHIRYDKKGAVAPGMSEDITIEFYQQNGNTTTTAFGSTAKKRILWFRYMRIPL